jgi:hypothetical protein
MYGHAQQQEITFLGTFNEKGNFTYSHADKKLFLTYALFRTHFFVRTFSYALFRTHFLDALFRAWTVAPSVGVFSKLTTKPTKPSKPTENK